VGKEEIDVNHLRILHFTDWICGNLRKWKFTQKKTPGTLQDSDKITERIRNEITGNISTEPTEKQRSKGVTVGNPIQRPCFVCHRYITKDGKRQVQKTSFGCKECHMSLCQVSRVGDDGGRTMTCCEEHQCDGGLFGGNGMHKKSAEVPDEGEINLHPRQSNRTRNKG